MFVDFFFYLKRAGIPVTLKELLDLLQLISTRPIYSVDEFYTLSRLVLVKDEQWYDRFDQAFGEYVEGKGVDVTVDKVDIPEEWIKKQFERYLSEEEKKQVEALGGWHKLMETLKQRLKEQQSRHQGGNRWIGTGGTSPFGAYGYNPEGIRIGQTSSRHRRAVKVWDERAFRDYDKDAELGKRNFQLALRKLRQFAKDGQKEHLDLPGTIRKTAQNAGYVELEMQAKKENQAKVVLLMDVGGSMDDHIAECEALFSAARSEFKYLEYFYFHNCVYETLWQDNARRHTDTFETKNFINKYCDDYRLIFIGDATMSPYELTMPGGSVEHMNEQPGHIWITRLTKHFKKSVWLNPVSEQYWSLTPSIQIISKLMSGKMFSMSMSGIDKAIKAL